MSSENDKWLILPHPTTSPVATWKWLKEWHHCVEVFLRKRPLQMFDIESFLFVVRRTLWITLFESTPTARFFAFLTQCITGRSSLQTPISASIDIPLMFVKGVLIRRTPPTLWLRYLLWFFSLDCTLLQTTSCTPLVTGILSVFPFPSLSNLISQVTFHFIIYFKWRSKIGGSYTGCFLLHALDNDWVIN